MPRSDAHPSELIDRTRRLTFQFEGRAYSAFPGETIGSALAAAGVKTFSRSFKYHRPRGLFCVTGKCPNCLMTVNGVPNVRVCVEPVSEKAVVIPQNCWPSLRYDVSSLIEKFDFLLPVGFYYKTLYRPRFMWKLADPVIRRLVGLGGWNKPGGQPPHYEHEYLHTDLLVIGGGPAGLAAAKSAAEAGIEVVLVDDQSGLGGHLRIHRRNFPDPATGSPRPGFEIARDLARGIEGNREIRVLCPATAIGGYEGGLTTVTTKNRLIQVRASQTVVAAGAFEYPALFGGNDLPGVMLGAGALRLLHCYGVKPGNNAVVVTANEEGLALALDLQQAGMRVAAVVDQRPESPESDAALKLQRLGVPHLFSSAPISAHGRNGVRSLVVGPATGPAGQSTMKTFSCDLVCISLHRSPALEVFRQNGGEVRYDSSLEQMVPVAGLSHVQVVGEATGFRDLAISTLQGRIAGLEAANRIRPPDVARSESLKRLRTSLDAAEKQYRQSRLALEEPRGVGQGKRFVCLCEDVTQEDMRLAVTEGFDEMELLKRYTTLSMGPCQGRMCLMPAARCAAQATGQSVAESGTTTSRPPVFSVAMGMIAGPHHHPVKLTPMHYQHIEAGARQMDMGEWKRPHSYTTPQEEWKAVREGVGLIDVSTLGKIRVQGRDAAKLLDKVYTHVFSSLQVGRSRYGVICGDDGIILDDGTVSRLGEDDFYLTTTTGNIEFVEKWLKWWIAGTGWCAHVTNVTADFAAANLAGPRARDVLNKLTQVDLSPAAFKYMQCAQDEVGGVAAILLRIGFVGETGWEIHYPACYGEYLWEALLDAGKEFGIACFGVEAQRILRLEKKHVIVGQDTDALSSPFEADLEWVIKFHKEDFIGKSSLLAAKTRGIDNRLIGFVADAVVEDGSAVVVDQQPVGRVTSARISPLENRCLGLAVVPSRLAAEGNSFQIRSNGQLVKARVHGPPFYDPEGVRLRE
jgi:sarcosine oxidase, subunit alpha